MMINGKSKDEASQLTPQAPQGAGRKHLPVLGSNHHSEDACVTTRTRADGVDFELPDRSGVSFARRDFLRVAAVGAAAAGLASGAGCAPTPENILPIPQRPEEARVGLPLNYATTCFGCAAGCGILAKVRDGHVIKVEGNPDHPINRGTTCARGQAIVLDAYDPDRARRSLRLFRSKEPAIDISNDLADSIVNEALSKAKGSAKVRLLTGALTGSAMRSLVEEFLAAFPGSRHVSWEPLGPLSETVAEAQFRSYGQRIVPTYNFHLADVIVSFGGEFLDTWLSPVQFARDFSSRRHPENPDQMSRLWVFEGRMSLTGSNADRRYRVRPSQLVDLALAIAHEIIVVRKHGPMASDSEIAKRLDGKGIDTVAAKLGVSVKVLKEVASDLASAAGKSLAIAGPTTGPNGLALEVAVNLINSALGNDGVTVDYTKPSHQFAGRHQDLTTLVEDMRGGKVDVLIVAGTNPAYSAPPVLGFADAMSKVPFIAAISDRADETAKHADVLCTAAQPIESWLDAEPVRGLHAVSQPAMRAVGEMRGLSDVLATWGYKLGASSKIAEAVKTALAKDSNPSAGYHFIREHWREKLFASVAAGRDFETFWVDLLHKGFRQARSDSDVPTRSFRATSLNLPERSAKEGMELVLFAPHALYDGRSGNNGWLLEYPDPVSRITWESWVSLSPKKMKALGLANGDIVEVSAAAGKVLVPAFEQAGQHDEVASIPLGYGRTDAGVVGNGIGVSGYQLIDIGALGPQFTAAAVSIRKTGDKVELPIPQGEAVIDLNERPLIPVTTLCEYRDDPAAGTEAPEEGASIWPKHPYPETRWGMAIDLSACIGCGACTIACQAENNIPTAGRKGVTRGREMHWLRVDRYYKLPVPRTANTPEEQKKVDEARAEAKSGEWLDNPEVLFHPLMCQHCENAPCETVCPVGATSHSSDGLNVQVYNRCVGTRYCSNNCPFKARRFNWFDYSRDRDSAIARVLEPAVKNIAEMNARWPLQMKFNPEVTVRSRGVMEKCTFCVQRIAVGRGKAKDEDRKIADGDIVTACQQVCPAQAIKFGNLSDPNSEVSRLNKSKRGLNMLNDQKVGTSVTYLSKVRNES